MVVHSGKQMEMLRELEALRQERDKWQQRAEAAEVAMASLFASLACCSTKAVTVSDPRRERSLRRELVSWVGERRRFHNALWADEVRFRDAPPYDVVAPVAAREQMGASLRCARRFLSGDELGRLQVELTQMPRTLSWGKAGDSKIALSRRKFFDLDAAAVECVTNGGDGVSRKALEADLADCPLRAACTPSLAMQVAAHVGFSLSPLRGIQANYQHTHYPQVRTFFRLPSSLLPNANASLLGSTATMPTATASEGTWRRSTCVEMAWWSSASTRTTRSCRHGGSHWRQGTSGQCRGGGMQTAMCGGSARTGCRS